MKIKKQLLPVFILALLFSFQAPVMAMTSTMPVKTEQQLGKKKKYKGYKKPKSKKFLGIFKRKTDCGCPNK